MPSAVLAFMLALQFSQGQTGELRLIVIDAAGLPLVARVTLTSEAIDVSDIRETGNDGILIARRLPFGPYRVAISREGFTTITERVVITAEQPIERRVTLTIAGVQSQLTVSAESTLIARDQAASTQHIGRDTLLRRPASVPGRSLVDVIQTQPGWLLEANGVLHPRGSEYQTQFVIDGLPITDNRSPAFAPEVDAEGVGGLTVMTAGYPAEYGRKLGAVIEVASETTSLPGFHGVASALFGSDATRSGEMAAGHIWGRSSLSASASASATDRYLDPPSEENLTNRGSTASLSARFDHDISGAHRIGMLGRSAGTRYSVPNEVIQEEAGQRQDAASDESAGQFSYQWLLAPEGIFDTRASLRRVDADLRSNALSTPILVSQDRGFTESYVRATFTTGRGIHEWKIGGDLLRASVREEFAYFITDSSAFDGELPVTFAFADTGVSNEQSLFLQDRIRHGGWTVNAGLRWDRYNFLVDEHAFSPRLAVAWSPAEDLVFRAAYDRAVETPAIENLLLASSPELDALGEHVLRLPVSPSRGHFIEGGITKGLSGLVRFGATAYRRSTTNFADDDVLLNTGVSFPTTFAHATIDGLELELDLPRRGALSGSIGYSLMHGTGELPITGGLFLDDDAADLLESRESFALTQDQRHTLQARIAYDLTRRGWIAGGIAYGSGLPFEAGEVDGDAAEEAEPRIRDRVDFEAGRVRGRLSLDISAGVNLGSSPRGLSVQVDVRNLTNRFDVINFAGLFSGTAIAPPRTVAVRLRAAF
jgi:outer membrane receptor protein involved in Fe transport